MCEVRKTLRHSCGGGNQSSVIPAKAGIHNYRARGNSSSHYPNAREKHSVIPTQAEIHPITRHSREGGNPPHHSSFPRRRESTIAAHAGIHRPTTPTLEKNTPSFPRRRESTIAAHAGIHRPTTRRPRKTLRHSRLRGNDVDFS